MLGLYWGNTDLNDLNAAFGMFEEKLLEHYNDCIPIKSKIVTSHDDNTPWMNDNLKHRIKQKQINFRLFKQGLISKDFYSDFRKKKHKT